MGRMHVMFSREQILLLWPLSGVDSALGVAKSRRRPKITEDSRATSIASSFQSSTKNDASQPYRVPLSRRDLLGQGKRRAKEMNPEREWILFGVYILDDVGRPMSLVLCSSFLDVC